MANAQCARTRDVVKVLEMLVNDLKNYPLLGSAESDPRMLAAFEVALRGEDAELDAHQTKVYERLVRSAEQRAGGEISFRAPLPTHAAANEKR